MDEEKKWQPSEGETVWVYYFNPSNRYGGVTCAIAPRKFEKRIANYLGKEGNERWSLILPTDPIGAKFGAAHRPHNVYPTGSQALSALQVAVKDKIRELENALHDALKGVGTT